jgi:hypothetical protein
MRLISCFIPGLLASMLWLAPALAADAPATFKVSEFNFKRPATWSWVETTSAMRKAQLKVTDAKSKESAEVVFFYFGPGGGGGTKANVDRWLGQFQDASQPKSEEVTIGKTKVTYVQTEGTYLSGQPGGAKTPMTNHALLGAIVEGAEGSVFIKLTGPKALAKSAEADFKKLVEGALK